MAGTQWRKTRDTANLRDRVGQVSTKMAPTERDSWTVVVAGMKIPGATSQWVLGDGVAGEGDALPQSSNCRTTSNNTMCDSDKDTPVRWGTEDGDIVPSTLDPSLASSPHPARDDITVVSSFVVRFAQAIIRNFIAALGNPLPRTL